MTGVIYVWCVQGCIWGMGATAEEAQQHAAGAALQQVGALPGAVTVAMAMQWIDGGSAIQMAGDRLEITRLLQGFGAAPPRQGEAQRKAVA